MNSIPSLTTLTIPSPYTLALGSISKFRRAVLDDLHIPYQTGVAGINEKEIRDNDPKQLTMKLACAKMDRVLEMNDLKNTIWITADQVAWKDGMIREKPVNTEECYRYLQSYVHSSVQFYSALCIYNTETKKRYVNCDVSSIEFHDIPQEVQDHLIEIGDVMYTCGGITVENPEFQKCIKRMDDYDRIMGLPLRIVQEGINYVSLFSVYMIRN